jgi:hypothetical protein
MSLKENSATISGYDGSHNKRTFDGLWFVTITISFISLNVISVPCPAQTNAPKVTQPLPASLTTNFVKDAELSVAEVNQVVSLAVQCGIPDVDQIRTFHYLPGLARGISVKSKERRSGRSVSYDTVSLGHTGWNTLPPGAKAKRLGAFWVNEPYLRTTLLREFAISNKTVRVQIGENIDMALADKVIPLVVARKVRFENDSARRQFEELDLSEPASFDKSWSGDGYELDYDRPEMRDVLFKVENGEILITGVATVVI